MTPLSWNHTGVRCQKSGCGRGAVPHRYPDFDITPIREGVQPRSGHQKVDYRVKLGVESEYESNFWIIRVFSLFFCYSMFFTIDFSQF